MGNLFSIDGPLWNFTNKILQFLWLSLLWAFCSLPIVTIGASTTALYTVMLAIIREQEGYLTSSFFRAFKVNFRQGTALWGFQVLAGILLLTDLAVYFRSTRTDAAAFLLMLLFFSVLVVFLFLFTWAYGILAKFDNTTRRILRNSLIMSICSWPSSLLMLIAGFAVAAVGFLWFPPLLFITPALLAWINSHFFSRAFQKYLPASRQVTPEYEQ
ncbi:MAG: DUF624 domain-containing protein [Lachnospiraceae bacterium]|nr:DUF624 domain-containing protein [Lachnospiraceae bacterium]